MRGSTQRRTFAVGVDVDARLEASLGEAVEIVLEVLIPLLPVIESPQFIARVGDVRPHQEELGELQRDAPPYDTSGIHGGRRC